jgi:hypothetical protein
MAAGLRVWTVRVESSVEPLDSSQQSRKSVVDMSTEAENIDEDTAD